MSTRPLRSSEAVWLREVSAQAARDSALLPAWALPVWTKPLTGIPVTVTGGKNISEEGTRGDD